MRQRVQMDTERPGVAAVKTRVAIRVQQGGAPTEGRHDMSTKVIIAGLAIALGTVWPAVAGAGETVSPASHEPLGRAWDDLMSQMHSLGERLRGHFEPVPAGERPVISLMLDHRREIGLTPAQVQELERIRTGFQREAIALEADERVAQLDVATLLDAEPVDLAKVEARIRDIERLRADLRMARIRAIERGKAQLSAEQREKLASLLGERRPRAGGTSTPSSEPPRRL
jgi:Spy/CpxP family protein refolding chaperone